MSTPKMNHQIALSKKVFKFFVCITIGVLATSIRAAQVCDIPPAFEQKTTNLTCTFDVDVKALKKEIAILHYDNNDPHNPETVMYSATFQGEKEYFTSPGFSIIGKVTNTLVLRVDRVTLSRIGIYECHILPSVAGDVQPCNLILKERVSDARDTSTPMDTTVTQNSTGDFEGHGENITFFAGLTIGLGIGMFLILVGVVTLLIILYKRSQRVKGSTKYKQADTGNQTESQGKYQV